MHNIIVNPVMMKKNGQNYISMTNKHIYDDLGLYFMLIRLGSSPNKFHPSKMRIWPFPHVNCKKVTSVPSLPPTRAQLARTPFTGCNTEYIWGNGRHWNCSENGTKAITWKYIYMELSPEVSSSLLLCYIWGGAQGQEKKINYHWQLQAAVHRRSHCPLLNFRRPPPRQ